MIYGQIIKKIRTDRKLTQAQLATLLQVDESQISRWENGHFEPARKTINKIQKVFGKQIFLSYVGTLGNNKQK